MNGETLFIIGMMIVITMVVTLVLFVWRMHRSRRLPASLRHMLHANFAELESVADHARRVLEAEKIIDHALSALGYGGTFAEKLQKAGPRFSARQTLWDAHKLRNRIAHERSVSVDEAQAKRAIAAFERALMDLS